MLEGEEDDEELDGLEKYFDLARHAARNPIDWWLAHEEDHHRLSIVALGNLVIPSQSSDSERASSAAAPLARISQRVATKVETLERLPSMRQWQKRGAISLLRVRGV